MLNYFMPRRFFPTHDKIVLHDPTHILTQANAYFTGTRIHALEQLLITLETHLNTLMVGGIHVGACVTKRAHFAIKK